MPFKEVLRKFNNIDAIAGKNDKRALLKNYLNNDEPFAKAVEYCLSETMTFNIKDLPPAGGESTKNAADVFKALDGLTKKRGATDADKQKLADLCGNGPTRAVVQKILNKSTDAGFSLRSVTTVAPWLLFQTPYQRCSTSAKLGNVQMPAVVQTKADGMFNYACSGFKSSGMFPHNFVTRRGKSFSIEAELEKELKMLTDRLEISYPDPVLMGEFTVVEFDGTVMPRKKGNGILNKFIKGTGDSTVADRVIYTVWDVVSLEDFKAKSSSVNYKTRLSSLQTAIAAAPTPDEAAFLMRNKILFGDLHRIKVIKSKHVDSMVDAQKFFKQERALGEEGAILKDYRALWQNNTSTLQVKMKNFVQAEVKIVGVIGGKGKYKGMMGALSVESQDGGIKCNVGSGFTDKERADMDYWQGHVDDIITVQFESVITDKNKKTKSLFLPTFVETRFNEKTQADTTKYMEQLEAEEA